jgi:hypothetical protein
MSRAAEGVEDEKGGRREEERPSRLLIPQSGWKRSSVIDE